MTSFITWQRQNQLINSISNSILKSIVQEVNTARIFSISIDTTFDISRHEQVSFVIRYTDESKGKIVDRLLMICTTSSTNSQTLYSIFLNIFEKTNIDWKNNLIGQSYDGAANM